jgi:hypothetical protein
MIKMVEKRDVYAEGFNVDAVAIREEMVQAAKEAADTFFDQKLGGVDQYACGFAWVTIYPRYKGNTKLGKVERNLLRNMGFKLDWTDKAFQMWNPSGHGCQNVDTKEAGAVAAAAVLKKYGFEAYAGSRLD